MPSKKQRERELPSTLAQEEPEGPPPPEPTPPVQVLYCAGRSTYYRRWTAFHKLVCSFPPEYCEFGDRLTRCKEWLQEAHPNLYEKYYSDGMSGIRQKRH
jgi:density-regulated protein